MVGLILCSRENSPEGRTKNTERGCMKQRWKPQKTCHTWKFAQTKCQLSVHRWLFYFHLDRYLNLNVHNCHPSLPHPCRSGADNLCFQFLRQKGIVGRGLTYSDGSPTYGLSWNFCNSWQCKSITQQVETILQILNSSSDLSRRNRMSRLDARQLSATNDKSWNYFKFPITKHWLVNCIMLKRLTGDKTNYPRKKLTKFIKNNS